MKKLFPLLAIITLLPYSTIAQLKEYNIGGHFSPIFNIPISIDDNNVNLISPTGSLNQATTTTNTSPVKMSSVTPGFNAGLDINFKFHNVCWKTGVSIIRRNLVFTQTSTDEGIASAYVLNNRINSIAAPIELDILLANHDKKITYGVYFVFGGMYERLISQGYSSQEISNANGTKSLDFIDLNNQYPKKGFKEHAATAFFGFKVNAIFKKIGLVDYGLSYRATALPVWTTNTRTSIPTKEGIQINHTSRDLFLTHISFDFTVYILNLTKRFKQYKYGFYTKYPGARRWDNR